MKVRRMMALLLAVLMVVSSLTGCQSKDDSTSKDGSVSKEEKEDASKETEKEEQEASVEPFTIEVYAHRHSTEASESDTLWIFEYMEYWMAQQGYDVTVEVTHGIGDYEQNLSMMLATDNLPDLMIGVPLTNTDAVTYGAEEGILLDWTPYINEEHMPNLMSLLEDNPAALTASICNDDKIYSLPTVKQYTYGWNAGSGTWCQSLYYYQPWLDECGITEMPETMEEFIDVLRAFKSEIELEGGEEVYPVLMTKGNLQRALWTALGYYGGAENVIWGTEFAIKDGELRLPAFTEDYEAFVGYLKTMYDEGLIHPDYFTMENEVIDALLVEGRGGIASDILLFPDTYKDWVGGYPIEAEGVEKAICTAGAPYEVGRVWASADIEHPEIIVEFLNYLYSPEGSVMYYYGPQKGQDPLGLVDGWWIDENNTVMVQEVLDGSFGDAGLYAFKYIQPYPFVLNYKDYSWKAQEMGGVEFEAKEIVWKDAITGDDFVMSVQKDYDNMDNIEGHRRTGQHQYLSENLTGVKLPGVYLSAEVGQRADELKLLIDDYIESETAKFVTGIRDISEVSAFQDELKQMGVEEYLGIYQDAYTTYLDSIFE